MKETLKAAMSDLKKSFIYTVEGARRVRRRSYTSEWLYSRDRELERYQDALLDQCRKTKAVVTQLYGKSDSTLEGPNIVLEKANNLIEELEYFAYRITVDSPDEIRRNGSLVYVEDIKNNLETYIGNLNKHAR